MLTRFISLILVSIILASCSSPVIKTNSGKEITAAEMDQFLNHQLDSLKLPALSIAFINNGKIVYHRALGVASINDARKVDDQSLFEAASLSKTVFAYFVMKMVEKGKLNLDKPLYQYLAFPEIAYDERYKKVTARMVLDHTSGFPNWRWYDEPDSALKIKRGDMYMTNPPGTFGYSGEGYHYLAKVVAHLNGLTLQSLDSLFQREVSVPLGLDHTYFSWDNYIGLHKVTGYQNDKVFEKAWPSAPPDEDSTVFGAASTLHTEAVSYARFLIALMENKGLKKSDIDEMLKVQSKIPKAQAANWGEITGWGLGMAIEETDHGIRYSHGGDNGGFQAGFMFYKDKKNGYVYFTNCDKGGAFYVKLRTLLGEMKSQ